jgi:hypothetical protein
VDPLLENDLEVARRTPPAEKLAQAIELMEAGLRLKREVLKRALPDASESELDVAFERWLIADE